jgi:hypothetical protein
LTLSAVLKRIQQALLIRIRKPKFISKRQKELRTQLTGKYDMMKINKNKNNIIVEPSFKSYKNTMNLLIHGIPVWRRVKIPPPQNCES